MKKEIFELSNELGKALLEKKATVTTAESCTGGGVANAITAVSGSSQWFHSAYVTYANNAKHDMLGISKALLLDQGAVSEAVVTEMVKAAAQAAKADYAVAISGIAGPSGGSPGKPVGTVWFGILGPQGIRCFKYQFVGDREAVREQSVQISLKELLHQVSECTTVHPYSN
jgi:nicotinamide-nucleotide amidase